MRRLAYILLAAFVFAFSDARPAGAQAPADKVVVSYPSKSITNFPILETAKQRGFFLGGTPERYAALKSGSIAASMLSAPHSLRAEKEGFTKLAATRDYVNVSGTGLIVHADQIKKRPAMMKRFMRGSLRAMNFIRENRADTIQMIMREFGMDQEVATLAYKQLLELLSPDGKNRVEGYQLLIDFARAAQKVDKPIHATQFIDETLLDEVLREGGTQR